jgi:uncharacterized protein
MKTQNITYFENAGSHNTIDTLKAVKNRANSLKPEAIIIASTTGATALKAAEILNTTEIDIIAVPFQKNLWSKWGSPKEEFAGKAKIMGVKFIPNKPEVVLIDRERADIVNAWRVLSTGCKVAIQCAAMAVDTGLVKEGAKVISIGGRVTGADTAIVLHAYSTENVLKSKVNEIITMPSNKKL